jgi:hypothetical protein
MLSRTRELSFELIRPGNQIPAGGGGEAVTDWQEDWGKEMESRLYYGLRNSV